MGSHLLALSKTLALPKVCPLASLASLAFSRAKVGQKLQGQKAKWLGNKYLKYIINCALLNIAVMVKLFFYLISIFKNILKFFNAAELCHLLFYLFNYLSKSIMRYHSLFIFLHKSNNLCHKDVKETLCNNSFPLGKDKR